VGNMCVACLLSARSHIAAVPNTASFVPKFRLNLTCVSIDQGTLPVAPRKKKMSIIEQLKLSPNRWKRGGKDLEPGVGGIWPGRPDANKYKVRGAFGLCRCLR
jgi:hypothetical protein